MSFGIYTTIDKSASPRSEVNQSGQVRDLPQSAKSVWAGGGRSERSESNNTFSSRLIQNTDLGKHSLELCGERDKPLKILDYL